MPKLKLTAIAVARLPPPPSGRVDYYDVAMPAFGLRISQTGARKYFFMKRLNDKLVRFTLGRAKTKDEGVGLTLKDAREKAGLLGDMIDRGIDPRQLKSAEKQENQKRATNTFETIGKRFMRQHVEARLAPSTAREYQRVLFGIDTANWKEQPVSTIKRADVIQVLDNIIERGSSGAANNTLAYLSKFFNWCAEKDLLEIPPTDRIKKPRKKKIGDRVLNAEECVDVWRSFDAEGGTFGDLLKLLLLTGQRRSEVAGMCMQELSNLDDTTAVWNIPASRTKNSRPHIVPLSQQAVAIIKNRPVLGYEGLLFTSTGSTPVSGFGRTKQRIDNHIAAKRHQQDRQTMPSWTIHDLRRTMVTMMNEHIAVAPHIIEACVNHMSGAAKSGIAGVYNKALYMPERRKAFDEWAIFLNNLIQKSN